MAGRRSWGSLAPRTQRRYASQGRSAGLTGRQEYGWRFLSASQKQRTTRWAEARGLDPREVYANPELRPVSVGQKGRQFKGRLLLDPVQAVRRPRDHEGWLYAHRDLVLTVARSPAGLKAFDALRAESIDAGVPTASVVMPPPGEPIGHISGSGSWDSIIVYLGGANGSPAAAGVVFAVFTFDPAVPWHLWWKDYEK